MPFEKQPPVNRIPHIRDLEITLRRSPDDPPQSIEFSMTIDDQFDSPMGHPSGDLVPHLPASVKADLQSFMDWCWEKANDEVIG